MHNFSYQSPSRRKGVFPFSYFTEYFLGTRVKEKFRSNRVIRWTLVGRGVFEGLTFVTHTEIKALSKKRHKRERERGRERESKLMYEWEKQKQPCNPTTFAIVLLKTSRLTWSCWGTVKIWKIININYQPRVREAASEIEKQENVAPNLTRNQTTATTFPTLEMELDIKNRIGFLRLWPYCWCLNGTNLEKSFTARRSTEGAGEKSIIFFGAMCVCVRAKAPA